EELLLWKVGKRLRQRRQKDGILLRRVERWLGDPQTPVVGFGLHIQGPHGIRGLAKERQLHPAVGIGHPLHGPPPPVEIDLSPLKRSPAIAQDTKRHSKSRAIRHHHAWIPPPRDRRHWLAIDVRM